MTESPTPQAMYDAVVEAIVKVVPEIADTCRWCHGGFHSCACNSWEQRDITLEDVLKTYVNSEQGERNHATDLFDDQVLLIVYNWHLNRSLEWHRDNAPETISFLHSLLPHE